MMKTDILYLIKQTRGTDEYGDPVISEESREVFCEVMSIGEKEFYQAHAVGLQPEVKFLLSDYIDYGGELYVEHDGIRYKVLRTYRKGQEIEITCYREVNQ